MTKPAASPILAFPIAHYGWFPLTEQVSDTSPAAPVDFKKLLLGTLHIAVLTAVAMAQPLFDLLGRNAEFFVARQSQPIDIWVMTLALLLVVPIGSFVVGALAMLISPKAYQVFVAVQVGILVGAFGLQVLKKVLPTNGWVLVLVASLFAVGAGIAYDRFATMRSFLTWMAPAPIVVATVFLLFTPVNRVVFPAAADTGLAATVTSDTPVVLVVWDEFNSIGITGTDGTIDSDSYPNFGRLADDSTWYRRASGVSDATSLAVPAIVDGQFPNPDLLPIAADHPRSLFSVLAESHEIFAREPVTALCVATVCEANTANLSSGGFLSRMRSLVSDLRVVYLHVLLPADLATSLPPIDRVWGDFGDNAASIDPTATTASADGVDRDEFSDLRANDHIRDELSGDRVASVESFIDGLPSGDMAKPPFVFLHAALPHAPYRYTPSGLQYTDSGEVYGLENGQWTGNEWAVSQAEQRYLMQLSVVDSLLGTLLDRLEEAGMYDDALVIVTADHGAGFTLDTRFRDATSETFGEIMSVPLFVKLPGQNEGVISDADARTTDVFPTVLEVLGIEVDWDVDGRSLLREPVNRGPKRQVRTDGVIVESDPRMPAWDRALANKVRRFGSDDTINVYKPGNDPLVGSPLSLLDIDESVGRAQVNRLESFGAYDSQSGLSLSHIVGTVEYNTLTSGKIGVAINGVVEVIGPLLDPGDSGGRFSFFVRDDAFVEGTNHIRMFHVDTDGRLYHIDIEAATTYSTSIYGDGNEYLESDGIGIPITNRISGSVDSIVSTESSVSISGWAADTVESLPADEIALVVDGVSVAVAGPTIPRQDVVSQLGEQSYLMSGFVLTIPSSLLKDAESVRVFAVVKGEEATEFRLTFGS